MTSSVLEAINKQIAAEFAASFSYLAMAGWCEHHKFMGAGRGCGSRAPKSTATP